MMDLAGVILAGGEGKRWGGPKAWAKLPDGRTFLEACAETLHEAGSRSMVATVPPGSDHAAIGVLNLVALPRPGLDMFGSLLVGLGRLVKAPDWRVVAVMPVDHPLVGSGTVNALAATVARAVIPSYNGKHGHPVCLDRAVAESLVRGDLQGPTLREVMHAVEARDLEVDDPGVIANCNTPDALAAALARLGDRSFEF